MGKTIQAIRGMHDVLPAEVGYWQYLEAVCREVVEAYGYQEIRLPLLEKTELFRRTIGEVTDIVEKEMYTFEDRNGDSLTLRPEGTAGCVRAGIQNGLLHNQVQRLWYLGPMFRHERPQQGRYRQFHQIGVEAFGESIPEVDLELILMSARLWRRLGLEGLELQVNTLGSPEARAAYQQALVAYLRQHEDRLDADSRRRLARNPLRVLDSKDPGVQAVLAEAPRLEDYLDAECRAHFQALEAMFRQAGLSYVVNPRLVRGLDYYTGTVFEWVSTELGAQGTVCAGGRYDGLVAQLGGQPTPAAGFAVGLERLISLLMTAPASVPSNAPDFYLAMVGEQAERQGPLWAEQLRDVCPQARVVSQSGGGFKAQLRRADRSGARYALILGDNELAAGRISVKPLRADQAQQEWHWQSLLARLDGASRAEIEQRLLD